MSDKFVEFTCLRVKRRWFVNPEYVLSFYATIWPKTDAVSCIEVKGQQGYGNHSIFVRDTVDEINAKLTNCKHD